METVPESFIFLVSEWRQISAEQKSENWRILERPPAAVVSRWRDGETRQPATSTTQTILLLSHSQAALTVLVKAA
jgi:hypothetical protein